MKQTQNKLVEPAVGRAGGAVRLREVNLHHGPALVWTSKAFLSPREEQVLDLLAQGLSSGEAARQMDLSLHTIKVHRRNIYKKLGVHTSAAAVALIFGGRVRLDEGAGCKCPQCGQDMSLNLAASR